MDQAQQLFTMPGMDPQDLGEFLGTFLRDLQSPKEKVQIGKAPCLAGAVQASCPPSESFILLLSLAIGPTDDYKLPLYRAIMSRINFIRASAKDAKPFLSSPHIVGILLTDADITKRKHARLLAKLVEFAKARGTVVLGGSFSTFFPLDKSDSFFGKAWGVPWQAGSYHRTTFKVNPSNQLVKMNPTLSASYSMKALHVKNISPDDAIYLASAESRLESHVFPADNITNLEESPVVCTCIGKGHLGYVGDVNWEEGSTTVILAMFGLLSPTSGSSPPAKEVTLSLQPLESADTNVRLDNVLKMVDKGIPGGEVLASVLSKIKTREKVRDRKKGNVKQSKPPVRSGVGRGKKNQRQEPWFDEEDDEMQQRLTNGGFTDDEVQELLCHGVKPWDDDAWVCSSVSFSAKPF